MATPRRAKGQNKQRRELVRVVSIVLGTGEPTEFRWESWCRYTIRQALCLHGNSWPVSDATAAKIVREALDKIGARRPPWSWGQIEFTWECGTRVEYTHCLQCGTRLPEDRPKFCSTTCGSTFRQAMHYAELRDWERCGSRLVKEGMNGKAHLWSNGNANGHARTGVVAANGANGSSPTRPMPERSSVPPNAGTTLPASSSPASEPISAPS